VVQRVIDDQLVDFRRQIGFKIGAGNALNFPSHDSDNVSRPERTGRGGLKAKITVMVSLVGLMRRWPKLNSM
jgi:hypothetical protein